MPVNILAQAFSEGLDSIPLGWTVVKLSPIFALLYLLKWYFNGAVNQSERNMHSKVVMVTVGICAVTKSESFADS
jgi:small-conductance mechanosensitive channel|tara:strand:+ start:1648 stop:1872 length:225 start_codon:yes stop_codon:yes gene_type:complete